MSCLFIINQPAGEILIPFKISFLKYKYYIYVCMCVHVNLSYTSVKVSVSRSVVSNSLCPMDCSLPDAFVHGILQARILERVAIPFSRGSSWPRERTRSPALQAYSLLSEPPGNPHLILKYEFSRVRNFGNIQVLIAWIAPHIPGFFFLLTSLLTVINHEKM